MRLYWERNQIKLEDDSSLILNCISNQWNIWELRRRDLMDSSRLWLHSRMITLIRISRLLSRLMMSVISLLIVHLSLPPPLLPYSIDPFQVSPPAQAFVRKTFSFLQTGQIEVIAAAFAFGREDLIPLMFTGLLKDMNKGLGGTLDTFIVYLERHIEVDGEEHGPMSLQMMTEICGDDNDPRWVMGIN